MKWENAAFNHCFTSSRLTSTGSFFKDDFLIPFDVKVPGVLYLFINVGQISTG